jgi:hypothetical protein
VRAWAPAKKTDRYPKLLKIITISNHKIANVFVVYADKTIDYIGFKKLI